MDSTFDLDGFLGFILLDGRRPRIDHDIPFRSPSVPTLVVPKSALPVGLLYWRDGRYAVRTVLAQTKARSPKPRAYRESGLIGRIVLELDLAKQEARPRLDCSETVGGARGETVGEAAAAPRAKLPVGLLRWGADGFEVETV